MSHHHHRHPSDTPKPLMKDLQVSLIQDCPKFSDTEPCVFREEGGIVQLGLPGFLYPFFAFLCDMFPVIVKGLRE